MMPRWGEGTLPAVFICACRGTASVCLAANSEYTYMDRTTGICLKAMMAICELCRQAGEQWEKVTMTIRETLASIRYVMNANGERTDVLIPLASWKAILASWKQMIELLEDQEDSAILQDWLEKRAAGKTDTITLDALEQELIADGLLPG